jgi:SAM-dependent methyltransferase
MQALDDPKRAAEIRSLISDKPTLKRLYIEFYGSYRRCLDHCPKDGLALELGSGAGFAKEIVPELTTTDVLPYDGVDQVVDATNLPFADHTVRFISMLNVFHHIPDVKAFFREAVRCLVPGGRILIIDQHPGWIGAPIYRYVHHEPYHPDTRDWRFVTSGPLSGANGALAWVVFVRDRDLYQATVPELELLRYQPIVPLRYWLTGGLKRWSALPGPAWRCATAVDHFLLSLSPQFGSFVEIELLKRP